MIRTLLWPLRLLFMASVAAFFVFIGFGGRQPDHQLSPLVVVLGPMMTFVEINVLRHRLSTKNGTDGESVGQRKP